MQRVPPLRGRVRRGSSLAPLRLPLLAVAALLGAAGLSACSSAPEIEDPPAQRIARAAALIEKERNLEAKDILEGVRGPVAGTLQEGEAVYLLARAHLALGNPADAEVLFETYLSRWPDGPHAARALYSRALCFIAKAERTRIGFFSLTKVVPSDRDITPLSQAEVLLAEYRSRYPGTPEAADAEGLIASLREKRGLHELEVADFYLWHGNTRAALFRARGVEKGDYPASVREKAASLARKAEAREAKGPDRENGTGGGRGGE